MSYAPSTPDGQDAARATGRTRAPRSRAARVGGYLVAIAINTALLFAIHVWPGWEAVPFLTDATVEVLPIVDASIVVGIVVNLLYLVGDPRWLRALGDAVTGAFAVAVLVRILQVFPFTFADEGWAWAVRFGLGVAILVSLIGVVVGMARFLSAAISGGGRPRPV